MRAPMRWFLPVATVLAGVAWLPAAAQNGPPAGSGPAAPLERAVDVWSAHALPDEEAARQGRAALPFTQDQIEILGRILRETQEATARGAGDPPAGRVRRIRLDGGAIYGTSVSGTSVSGTSVSGTSVPAIAVRRGYVTASLVHGFDRRPLAHRGGPGGPPIPAAGQRRGGRIGK